MPKDSVNTKLAVIENRLGNIEEKVGHIDSQIGNNYITKAEFEPVKKLVYGLVSLILVAVVGAIMALVIK